MPLALLRMILPMLLGSLSTVGTRMGLGKLAASTAVPKALSGLAGVAGGKGMLPEAITGMLGFIPGYAGGEVLNEMLMGSPEQSSDSAQFQQLVSQLGRPQPPADNQRNLMALMQQEQQRGGLDSLLEELGIPSPAVV